MLSPQLISRFAIYVSVTQPRRRTVGERLQPTLDNAHIEKAKYERKGRFNLLLLLGGPSIYSIFTDALSPAMMNGYALNLAIGLQVILGALVTGLSSVVSPARVS